MPAVKAATCRARHRARGRVRMWTSRIRRRARGPAAQPRSCGRSGRSGRAPGRVLEPVRRGEHTTGLPGRRGSRPSRKDWSSVAVCSRSPSPPPPPRRSPIRVRSRRCTGAPARSGAPLRTGCGCAARRRRRKPPTNSTRGAEERHARLARDGLREERLARARRPVQHDALGSRAPIGLEPAGSRRYSAISMTSSRISSMPRRRRTSSATGPADAVVEPGAAHLAHVQKIRSTSRP